MNEKTQLSKKHSDSVEHKLRERERKVMPLSSQKMFWPIRLAHQHWQIQHKTQSTNQNAYIIQGIFVLPWFKITVRLTKNLGTKEDVVGEWKSL